MISYLVKIFILLAFSFFVIYNYYFWSVSHIENFDGYLSYIIIIWIIYLIYKYLQIDLLVDKVNYSLGKIVLFFFSHLLILCFLYFSYSDIVVSSWLALFFKILFYLLLPISILVISFIFWRKVSKTFNLEQENDTYNFLLWLWIWFFSFLFLLVFIWILGFYNIWSIFIILLWFLIYWFKEIAPTFNWFLNYSFEVDVTEWNYAKLVSTEFLFLVSTLILSTTLINIIRPFPIWWDDLWAYMNYPHLFAEAGSIISIWWMHTWEIFTGIGYVFSWATQAFFMNSMWGFLAFIATVLISKDLIKSTSLNKKSFLDIPMLIWTIFISMPMLVFQQAKDMKLDAGLFFVSILALYLLFKYYLWDNKNWKESISIIFIIWLLAWFVFTIKFTSLLFISAIIWLIVYSRLGVYWFSWYIAIFFAVFTKANLWKHMNVVVNPDNIAWFETKFALFSWLLWLILLIYSFVNNKEIVKKFFTELGIFFIWLLIGLSPWVGKNIADTYPDISVSNIISWKSSSFIFDKTKVKTAEELIQIDEKKKQQKLASDGTIWNEDWGRYLGYEKWVNNYIKLPWNLTMQVNQWWEFTNIWFIFLALLPVILLFLPYRNKNYAYFIVIFLLLELFVFVKIDNDIVDISNISSIKIETRDLVFEKNNSVFKNNYWNKDIYDVDMNSYIWDADIDKLVDWPNTFDLLKNKTEKAFYAELKEKIKSEEITKKINLTSTDLTDTDLIYLKELKQINNKNYNFNSDITSIVALEQLIKKHSISDKQQLIKLWKEKRSLNQILTDTFAQYNLPFWYAIILFLFLLPVSFLFFALRKDSEEKNIELFKLNTIFVSFYTFLWAISAFWVVWYGIVMYFSFLLAIWICIYYISSYNDSDSDIKKLNKILWTSAVSLVFLIYIFFSVLPHTFSNLKKAWYNKFKVWEITASSAPYLYHKEYLKILYSLNIAEDKKEDFLSEYIDDDIVNALPTITTTDIEIVKNTLNELVSKKDKKYSSKAKESLEMIYKNISNPSDKYKNKSIIYRAGTFLKYHISENKTRLLEDSLLFTFDDYIYDGNIIETVNNFKKVWVSYLLLDLNAATIDKDERHNLTTRYENLLYTFTSNELELIETDSICLKVALEDFNKSNRTLEAVQAYMWVAWVNYESYTDDGTQIKRWTKLLNCYKKINSHMKDKKIDNENYPYLLNLYNYIEKNKESYDTENKVYKLFQDQVKHWYKALFKIK